MNEQAIRFRLGIFVLAALLLLAVMITLFGGFPSYFRHVDTYTIIFKDAQGVAPGTPVRRSGVKIGEVRALTLDNTTGTVRVLIQVDSEYSLRASDRPTIVQGLLGGDTAVAFLAPPEEPKGPVVLVEPGSVLQGFTQADAQTLVQKTAQVMPQAEEAMIEVRKVFQKLDKLTPLMESTLKQYEQIGKAALDTVPELKKTNEELQITSRQWTRVGERMDVILATNEDKVQRALTQLEDVLRRASLTFSDENQKNITDTLRNVSKSSARLDSIASGTDDFLKETRESLKKINGSLMRTDALLEDLQRATKPFGERSPIIVKNLEDSTDNLNKTMIDVRDLVRAVGRGDGTIQRFLSDPTLYNNLNDTATMVNHMLPRVNRALGDFEIFADKLARHPELLGIGGAIRPSSGVKETHSVIPWR